MAFPTQRLRRLRSCEPLRRMVAETHLTVSDFIAPFFVQHGSSSRNEIPSMPGIFRLTVDELVKDVQEAAGLGIPAVLLFGIPARKDMRGSEARDDNGIIQQAVRAIKAAKTGIRIITDVCLCEYTSHGHCGLIDEDGTVDNDATLVLLQEMAVSHARAGADMVAPSDMMDGRIDAVRCALDEYGYEQLPIMAYSAKYASAFYGPFRDAADSAPQFGDRRSYQMDPPNVNEALREVELDIAEGADIVMVKPALAYLDVIRRVKDEFRVPLAAYNVSGEYAMVKAAGLAGWIDAEAVMLEMLTAVKRAGADMILTYFAKEAARVLKDK